MQIAAARGKVEWALEAQNFRRVLLQTLTAPQSIDFTKVPHELNDALGGAMRSQTDWSGFAQQLYLLRQYLGNYLCDFYIKTESQALKLVVVTSYGGQLNEATFKEQFDHSWVIMQSLESHIQQFKLSPAVMQFLQTARDQYKNDQNPVVGAAVDLAWSFLAVANASGGPRASFFAICPFGLDGTLAARIRASAYAPAQGGAGAQPAQEAVAWSCAAPNFNPGDLYFGPLDVFDSHMFKQSM
jgi:hypothetical protein